MADVRENCRYVFDRIEVAAARSSRQASSIRLIAVTKTVEPSRIRQAVECGVREIGENRLQEAISKRAALQDLPLRWHFIGRLQTNKARKAAEMFDCIHSLDRVELAEKLNGYAPRSIPVLIEVNLGEESSKSGALEANVGGLVSRIRELRMLDLCGLMSIPPFNVNPEASRPYFRRLRELAARFGLKELSMGMSHDFEIAIEEGATMIRVGTALFGARG